MLAEESMLSSSSFIHISMESSAKYSNEGVAYNPLTQPSHRLESCGGKMLVSLFTLIVPAVVFILILYHRAKFKEQRITRIGLAGSLIGFPLYLLMQYLLFGRTENMRSDWRMSHD
jgi:hypothetical protein